MKGANFMNINNFNLGSNFRASQMQQNKLELNPEEVVKVEPNQQFEVKEKIVKDIIRVHMDENGNEYYTVEQSDKHQVVWDNGRVVDADNGTMISPGGKEPFAIANAKEVYNNKAQAAGGKKLP